MDLAEVCPSFLRHRCPTAAVDIVLAKAAALDEAGQRPTLFIALLTVICIHPWALWPLWHPRAITSLSPVLCAGLAQAWIRAGCPEDDVRGAQCYRMRREVRCDRRDAHTHIPRVLTKIHQGPAAGKIASTNTTKHAVREIGRAANGRDKSTPIVMYCLLLSSLTLTSCSHAILRVAPPVLPLGAHVPRRRLRPPRASQHGHAFRYHPRAPRRRRTARRPAPIRGLARARQPAHFLPPAPSPPFMPTRCSVRARGNVCAQPLGNIVPSSTSARVVCTRGCRELIVPVPTRYPPHISQRVPSPPNDARHLPVPPPPPPPPCVLPHHLQALARVLATGDEILHCDIFEWLVLAGLAQDVLLEARLPRSFRLPRTTLPPPIFAPPCLSPRCVCLRAFAAKGENTENTTQRRLRWRRAALRQDRSYEAITFHISRSR